MTICEFRTETSYECWDLDKYMEWRRANDQVGTYPDRSIKDHPLLGKRFERNGTIYIVESVHKHWWGGYYEHAVLLMEGTKSHGTATIKNINSINEVIVEHAAEWAAEAKEL